MMMSASQVIGRELVCAGAGAAAGALRATLCGMAHFLARHTPYTHIADSIEELNMESDVALIEAIIEDLSTHAQSHTRPQRRSVALSMRQLQGAMEEMREALQNLRSQLEAHRRLWFSAYRTFDAAGHLRLLRLCKRRLDHHFDRLVKVHQLFVHNP